MNKKTRDEFVDLFAEGFQGLVVPEINKLDEKIDKVGEKLTKVENRLEKVENRLEKVENRLEVVEVKLDRVAANQLEDRTVLKDHEKRIKKSESVRILA